MARSVFNLVGRITMEGLGGVAKGLNDAEKGAVKFSKEINKVGRNIGKAGMAITKATAPLIALGVASVKFGADFEQAMTNSMAIMGDLSDAMKKDMSGAAREVAKTTKFSAKEAAEAYYFLAAAGLDAAQSIE